MLSQKSIEPGWPIAEQFLYSCVRSFYNPVHWNETVALTENPDFDWPTISRLVNISDDHVNDVGRIAPFMYHILREQPFVPDSVLSSLRRQYMIAANTNQFYFDELGKVLQQLSDAEIDVIVLKGAVLAHTVYDNIGLRPMGDLDLLVQEKDYEQTTIILQSLGYKFGKKVTSLELYTQEISLEKQSGNNFVIIDLHIQLLFTLSAQPRVNIDWFWQEVKPIHIRGIHTKALSDEAMLIHLCAHHFGHNIRHSGHDLARWIDIIQLIDVSRKTIDWNKVIEQSKTLDLVLGLKTILPAIQQIHPIIPSQFLTKIEALEVSQNEQHELKVDHGISEHLDKHPGAIRFRLTLNQLKEQPNWSEKFKLIVNDLFPTKQSMMQYYNVKSSLLLPIYYVYRLCLGARVVISGLLTNKALSGK